MKNNIDAAISKTYQTIDYVNVTKELIRNPELQKMADEYFKWMTLPNIPIEEGMCVYLHDWDSFVRWASWKLQNWEITSTQDIWVM